MKTQNEASSLFVAPKAFVRMDFETRSEADIKEVGAYEYCFHPSTQIMCLAFQIGQGEVCLWHPFPNINKPQPPPKALLDAINAGAKIEAHNAFFEFCVWNLVGHRQFGWPKLEQKLFNCSAAKASAMALPRSLAGLGAALRTDEQKDEDGRRLMLKLSKPRRPTKSDPTSKWHESPAELNRLFAYCKGDVRAEAAASRILKPLSAFEDKVWRLNQKINLNGVKCDRKSVDSALYLVGEIRTDLKSELVRITNGTVNTASELANIHRFIESEGDNLPNLQKQTVEEYLSAGLLKSEKSKRVLEIRSLLGRSSVDKFAAMRARMNKVDDRIRDILLYHGASTGRESGQGLQIQNLPRGGSDDMRECIAVMNTRDVELFKNCYADPMRAISNVIRGMLIPDTGKIFRAVDWSAIEARVLAWLAGEQWVLEVFTTTGKIYEATAAGIYGVPMEEITKKDWRRQIGKVADLALGYQGGVGAFQSMAKNYGVTVTDQEAEAIKVKWRNAHPMTVRFWRALEEGAFKCVITKRPVDVRGLVFQIEGRFLTLRLPSGRKLYYCDTKVKSHETPWGQVKDSVHFWYVDSQTKRWVEGPVHGGLWCENVVQAVARDVLKEAMVKLDSQGFGVCFDVHDEIVCEDKPNFESLKTMESVMIERPEWAVGLPLAVEGWEGDRYQK